MLPCVAFDCLTKTFPSSYSLSLASPSVSTTASNTLLNPKLSQVFHPVTARRQDVPVTFSDSSKIGKGTSRLVVSPPTVLLPLTPAIRLLVTEVIQLSSILLDTPLSRSTVTALVVDAYKSTSDEYGEHEALIWADDYSFPDDISTRDTQLLLSSNFDLATMTSFSTPV
jgi:hypothetical protein